MGFYITLQKVKMKVVVNKCYGGFGLSIEALKELVKRKADCIECTTPKEYYGGNGQYVHSKEWEKRWLKDFEDYEDIGDGMKADKKRGYNIYKDGVLYHLQSLYDDSIRSDKDLVEVVEMLGDAANSWAAKLTVVEIPEGIEWELDEYDGIETIREKHRSW